MNDDHKHRAAILHDAILTLVHRNPDLTLRQMGVLILCAQYAEPELRQVGLLASDLGTSKVAVTRAADKFEGLGWLRRSVPDNDRRGCVLTLTAAGRAEVEGWTAG